MLEPGSLIPRFTVTDHLGRPFDSSELAGRWSVLWWYVQADTPG